MDAGLEVFGTTGFHSATVTHLCRVAGVSTRSFYEHFNSRDDLLTAVYIDIEREIGHLTGTLQGPGEGDLGPWLAQSLDTVLGPLLDDERKARITQIEIVGVSPFVERVRRAASAEIARHVEAAIDNLVASPPMTDLDRQTLAHFMAGGATELLSDRLTIPPEERSSRAQFLDQLTKVLLKLLR